MGFLQEADSLVSEFLISKIPLFADDSRCISHSDIGPAISVASAVISAKLDADFHAVLPLAASTELVLMAALMCGSIGDQKRQSGGELISRNGMPLLKSDYTLAAGLRVAKGLEFDEIAELFRSARSAFEAIGRRGTVPARTRSDAEATARLTRDGVSGLYGCVARIVCRRSSSSIEEEVWIEFANRIGSSVEISRRLDEMRNLATLTPTDFAISSDFTRCMLAECQRDADLAEAMLEELEVSGSTLRSLVEFSRHLAAR